MLKTERLELLPQLLSLKVRLKGFSDLGYLHGEFRCGRTSCRVFIVTTLRERKYDLAAGCKIGHGRSYDP